MAKTLLERIETLIGTVTAYDGRLCLWAGGRPHDLRDVAMRLKTTKDDVADALPTFEKAKRGRANISEDISEE